LVSASRFLRFIPDGPLTIHNVLCKTNHGRIIARTFKARFVSLDLVQPDEIVLTCIFDEEQQSRDAYKVPKELIPKGKHNYGVLINENVIYMTLRPDLIALNNVYPYWRCTVKCNDCKRHSYRKIEWIL
jgi:hypothetical protein